MEEIKLEEDFEAKDEFVHTVHFTCDPVFDQDSIKPEIKTEPLEDSSILRVGNDDLGMEVTSIDEEVVDVDEFYSKKRTARVLYVDLTDSGIDERPCRSLADNSKSVHKKRKPGCSMTELNIKKKIPEEINDDDDNFQQVILNQEKIVSTLFHYQNKNKIENLETLQKETNYNHDKNIRKNVLNCNICFITLFDKNFAVSHYSMSHILFFNKIKYKCSKCDQVYDVKHKGCDGLRYQCTFEKCLFTADQILDFRYHFICHYAIAKKNYWISCQFCSCGPINQRLLQSHYIGCENARRLSRICKRVCNIFDKALMVDHFNSDHSEFNLFMRYACPYCSVQFGNVLEINKHFSCHVTNNTPMYMCTYNRCTVKSKNVKEYIFHYLSQHELIEEQFVCSSCLFQSKTLKFLQKHESYCSKKTVACPQCNHNFSTKKDLLKHFSKFHKQLFYCLKYYCNYCSSENFSIDVIKEHFSSNHKKFPEYYKCYFLECSFKTHHGSDYQYHLIYDHIKALEINVDNVIIPIDHNLMNILLSNESENEHVNTEGSQNDSSHKSHEADIKTEELKNNNIDKELERDIISKQDEGLSENHIIQKELLTCHLCCFRLSTKILTVKHYSSAHESFVTKQKYKCGTCGLSFKDNVAVFTHFAVKHKDDKFSFQCLFGHCYFTTDQLLDYQYHFICHYASTKKVRNKKQLSQAQHFKKIPLFTCKPCLFSASTKILKQKHVQKCMKSKGCCYICQQKLSMNQTTVLNHFAQDHSEFFVFIQYKCPYCHVKFSNVLEINRHFLSSHFMEAQYACSFYRCSFKTQNVKTYVFHYICAHLFFEKTFVCIYCLVHTETGQGLKKHNCNQKKSICNQCDYVAENKEKFLSHYSDVHKTQFGFIKYYCNYCLFENVDLKLMKIHFSFNHKSFPHYYKCLDANCSFSTYFVRDYQYHLIYTGSLGMPRNVCSEFSKVVSPKWEFNEFFEKCKKRQMNGEDIIFNCLHCVFSGNQNDVMIHYSEGHQDVLNSITYKCNSFPCPYLDNCFSLSEIQKHLVAKHVDLELKPYKCRITSCDFTSSNTTDYNFHYIFVHMAQDYKMANKYCSCDKCLFQPKSLVDSSNNNLKCQSMIRHCVICDLNIGGKENILQHLKIQHETILNSLEYECYYCCSRELNVKTIKLHFQWKHPDTCELYKCIAKKCLFSTKNIADYQIHFLFNHYVQDDYKFSCKYCLFKLKDSGNIELHESKCSFKKLESRICDYKHLLGKNNFLEHCVTYHKAFLTSLPYNCYYCPKNFKQNTLLEYHLIIKHPNMKILYVCPGCLFKTLRLEDYQFHYIYAHCKSSHETCTYCSHSEYQEKCRSCVVKETILMHYGTENERLDCPITLPLSEFTLRQQMFFKESKHYICDAEDCAFRCMDRSDYDIHCNLMHFKCQGETLIPDKLICRLCKYTNSSDKDMLLNHYLTNHKLAFYLIKYQCVYCLKIFNEFIDLKQHLTSNHSYFEQLINCIECKTHYSLSQINVYQFHYLDVHLKVNGTSLDVAHQNEQHHNKKLEDAVKFECRLCDFNNVIEKVVLIKHYSTTHPIKFNSISCQCGYCLQNFRNFLSLRKHFDLKHFESEELYSCEACLQIFTREMDYQFHYIQEHWTIE